MCGIFACFGEALDKETAEKCVKTMHHRGPDVCNMWLHSRICMGHTRLSIVDTSDRGNQPFLDTENQIILVKNGEIYNHAELRKQFSFTGSRGYHFQSDSDSEVVIPLYLKYRDMLAHTSPLLGSDIMDKLWFT